MNILIFSGNSLRNRDYGLEVEAKIKDLFESTYLQAYRHWETGQEWIDLPHELETLNSQAPTGDYGVFAKSIGTVLAVRAIKQGIIAPKFLLLCGLPLGYIVKDYPEFGSELASTGVPTVIIQNNQDPVGSVQDTQAYLADFGDFNLIITQGETHDYEDYSLLREQLQTLQKSV